MIVHTVGELKKVLQDMADDMELIGYNGYEEVLNGIMVFENDQDESPTGKPSITIGVEN